MAMIRHDVIAGTHTLESGGGRESSERLLAQFQKKVAKVELSGVLFWLGDERKRDEIEIVERGTSCCASGRRQWTETHLEIASGF